MVKTMPKIGEPSVPREEKIDTNLLDEAVYDQIHEEVPEGVSNENFDIIQSILVPRRRKKQDRDAFRYRTQRPDETAQRFAAKLRKLAALASPQLAVRNSFAERSPESLKGTIDLATSLEEPPVATNVPPNLNAPTNSPSDLSQRPRQHAGRRRQPRDRRVLPWVARENAENPSSSESRQDAYLPFVFPCLFHVSLPTIIGSTNGDNGRMLADTGSAVTLVRDAPAIPRQRIPPGRQLWAANNTKIITLGSTVVTFQIGTQTDPRSDGGTRPTVGRHPRDRFPHPPRVHRKHDTEPIVHQRRTCTIRPNDP
ncbi:unnamed protein product [Echinostoma caproni]|uniref:Peptidase A2 domain-containing protein n=1 Tax=Echinostoma caproni TaxID=27848 RepID=A0A183BEG8_9TREM|nr:unnamed protein product [Echinostoma caproni]